MKTIRIPQGNDFSLFVPLVLKDGTAVEGERLSDIQVLLQSAPPRQSYAVSVNVQSNYVVITPQVELPLGSYDLTITSKYENRDIAILLNNCFSISTWTNGSDYEKYLVGKEIILEQQVLIGAFNTDAELETLKEQYRAAIAATETARLQYEAAKEAFDEKAEKLEDVAQETTSQEILSAVNNIDFSHVEDKIDEVQQDVADVKEAVENIDFSELAKQGTNANATNTAILEAVSDNAALNIEVAAGKQAIVDAISERGGTATSSMSFSQLADAVNTLPAIYMSGLTWQDGVTISTVTQAIVRKNTSLVAIDDDSIETNTDTYAFAYMSALRTIRLANLRSNLYSNIVLQSNKLTHIDFPNLETTAGMIITSTDIVSVNLPRLRDCNGDFFLYRCSGELNIDSIETCSGIFLGYNQAAGYGRLNITTLNLPRFRGNTSTYTLCFGSTTLKEVILPEWREVGPVFLGGPNETRSELRRVYIPKVSSFSTNQVFTYCPSLIDIETGAFFRGNTSLRGWDPTNALSSSSTSLVDDGETFASNLEKLLYNIRNHIAANMPDRTGLSAFTITFSANVKAAINADAETVAAFTNKNWTIA